MPEIRLARIQVEYPEGCKVPVVTLSSVAGRWDDVEMEHHVAYPILGADAVFYETAYHAPVGAMEGGLTVIRYMMAGQAHDLLCTDTSTKEGAIFDLVIETEVLPRVLSHGSPHLSPPRWALKDWASRDPEASFSM